jgi:hypothetical protein
VQPNGPPSQKQRGKHQPYRRICDGNCTQARFCKPSRIQENTGAIPFIARTLKHKCIYYDGRFGTIKMNNTVASIRKAEFKVPDSIWLLSGIGNKGSLYVSNLTNINSDRVR